MFDRIVCLNVDHRLGERERIDREFASVGMKVDYFLAGKGQLAASSAYGHIDTTTPPPLSNYPWSQRINSYNAFLCFKKILKQAKQDGIETILICEDDVTLTTHFGEVLQAASSEIDAQRLTWDMLYLGANHTWGRTREVSPHLLKLLGGSQCWHCVACRSSVFDRIIALPFHSPIDDMCARHIQPNHECYAVWPSIGLQKPGFSFCENSQQDYSHYFAHKGIA